MKTKTNSILAKPEKTYPRRSKKRRQRSLVPKFAMAGLEYAPISHDD
jgi:hypothetical protein